MATPIKDKELAYKLDTDQAPETTRALLSLLGEYNKGDEPEETEDEAKLRENRDAALDFMTRYYNSDYYKNMVGGREMLQSELGFEDSALGERMRNIDFNIDLSHPGSYHETYFPEDRPFQGDLRNPAGSVGVGRAGLDDHTVVTHELSHAMGEPSPMAHDFDGDLTIQRNESFDRHMLQGNPSRVPSVSGAYLDVLGYPVAKPSWASEEDRGTAVTESAEQIGDPSSYVASNINEDSPTNYLRYIQNPTELVARTRAVTQMLQEEGVMDEGDFDLQYQNIYKAYKLGNTQARDILVAMGVIDLFKSDVGLEGADLSDQPHDRLKNDDGEPLTVGQVAEMNWNKIFRGNL
jgi:hypothetical protein